MVDFKRVPFILETTKRLKEKGVEVNLKLVGAGADLEKYKGKKWATQPNRGRREKLSEEYR